MSILAPAPQTVPSRGDRKNTRPFTGLRRMQARFGGIILALLIIVGCSGESGDTAADRRYPTLFFAIDGLEWKVMQPLLRDGKLPVIQHLMARGKFGYLNSMQPTFSPVIWTSIATGKRPEKHGIKHFVYPVSNSERPEYRYYTSGHRETKAFWNILSDYDLTVDCFGWWMTFPAETINGVMVSQTNTTGVLRDPQRALWKGTLLQGVEDQVYPPEKQNWVMSLLDDVDSSLDELTHSIFGEFPHPMTEFGELMWDQTLWAFRADAVYVRAAKELLDTGQPFDLMAVYIGGPDVAGHRFWRYAYPGEFAHPPSKEQIENFGSVIDDYYMYVDGVIGSLIDAAPTGTSVVIATDHGMDTFNTHQIFRASDPPLKTNSGHHLEAPPGVFIAAGNHISSSSRSPDFVKQISLATLPIVGGVLDILPTLLTLKGVPIGDDFDGHVLRGVIDPQWLDEVGIRRVPTHDDKKWLAGRADRIREAVDETERLEQLRSLGYIR